MTTKRIEYIDAMRGFMMILVVFAHISLYAYHENIVTWGSVFVQFHMSLFFFVSGFVLYKHERIWTGLTLCEFLWQKFKVQIISTVCFLFVYSLWSSLTWDNVWSDKYKAGYWFTLSLFEYFVLYMLFDAVLQRLRIKRGGDDALLWLFAIVVFAASTGHVCRIFLTAVLG